MRYALTLALALAACSDGRAKLADDLRPRLQAEVDFSLRMLRPYLGKYGRGPTCGTLDVSRPGAFAFDIATKLGVKLERGEEIKQLNEQAMIDCGGP